MKKFKNKRVKKYFLYACMVLILASTGALFYIKTNGNAEKTQKQDPDIDANNKTDYSPPSSDEKTESERNKNEIVQRMDKTKDTPSSTESPISVTITRASRNYVGVYIEKLSEGTCTMSIIQNNQEKISITAKVITEPEYSTCEGFSVDPTKLENGPFKVSIYVSSGNRKGTVSQEVN